MSGRLSQKRRTIMSITDLVNIPRGVNQGLNAARQMTMLSLLGNPRGGNYDQECRPVTNARLRASVVTRSVGHGRNVVRPVRAQFDDFDQQPFVGNGD
jgi:hypothetical protein